jgi:hypothetical protein
MSRLEHLITIKSFLTPGEADLMQSYLAAEDIYSFLKDEHSVTMQPYLANAIGGVKLQVREEDAERTMEVLRSAGLLKETTSERNKEQNKVLLILSAVIIISILLYYFLKAMTSFSN